VGNFLEKKATLIWYFRNNLLTLPTVSEREEIAIQKDVSKILNLIYFIGGNGIEYDQMESRPKGIRFMENETAEEG
jgi:hypothetical protein